MDGLNVQHKKPLKQEKMYEEQNFTFGMKKDFLCIQQIKNVIKQRTHF